MNLYKTTADADDDQGARMVTIWSGSQAAASKDRVAYKKQSYKGVGTEEVEVPTNKVGLIEFLNQLGAA